MFKGSNRSFARYAGKIVEKIIQSLPTFQIVKQGLERNSRPAENGRSAQYVRIA